MLCSVSVAAVTVASSVSHLTVYPPAADLTDDSVEIHFRHRLGY